MAKYGSANCVLLVDGYNVLGVTTQIEHIIEALLDETTGLGDEWQEHTYAGVNRAAITQEGFFDDDSNSSNDALNEKQGNERVLCLGYEGNTIGKKFSGFQGAMQASFARIASRGTLHRANASYNGSGTVEDGKILHALTARTVDGDTESTPVNNGAQTTDGGAAYLQVSDLALGGYTNVTIKVRQSADGVIWEDLDTFTVVTAAPAKERRVIAGTIKQYLAVSWDFVGAGVDPSITFFAGVARN